MHELVDLLLLMCMTIFTTSFAFDMLLKSASTPPRGEIITVATADSRMYNIHGQPSKDKGQQKEVPETRERPPPIRFVEVLRVKIGFKKQKRNPHFPPTPADSTE